MNAMKWLCARIMETPTKRKRKEAKDKGFRVHTIKLRKILNEGLFVNYPLASQPEVDNEPYVVLWRAVIDQHLKDIIAHHMLKRDFHLYYDARKFIDDQLNGNGCECDLAFLDPEKTKTLFTKLEQVCRMLREKGITL